MNDKPEECECCLFTTKKLTAYERRSAPNRDQKKWLCELCASSYAGVVVDYTTQYTHETRAIVGVICFVGNTLLAAIRAAK